MLLCGSFFKWINQRKGTPVKPLWLIAGFVTKIIAGLAYGYIYQHYYATSDSWAYFKESLIDYHDLLHNPSAYFATNGKFNQLSDFFSTADNAFWNNAGENALIKLLGILNIFSAGNYYVDSILYNSFSFAGLYLIYNTTIYYLRKNKLLLFLIIFFLPSSLFWNSGIDKEGLIVFFSGILIYAVHKCLTQKTNGTRITMSMVGFAGILVMRNFNAVLFLPAILSWIHVAKRTRLQYVPFIIIYSISIALFFLSAQSSFNLPQKLAEKQHQFLALEANTRLPLTPLQPTLVSYVSVLPQALNHVLLRPYPTEISTPFHLMAFIENTLVLLMIAFAMISRHKTESTFTLPFLVFLIAVSLSALLLIGYTVPFTGAIIRYKSFYTILLLIPFAGAINIKNKNLNVKPA